MPFQKGNKLGERAKAFNHELRKIITQSPDKLRRAAESLLEAAASGDLGAIRELADRLDGKAQQSIEGRFEHEHTVATGDASTLTERLDRALSSRTDNTVQ